MQNAANILTAANQGATNYPSGAGNVGVHLPYAPTQWTNGQTASSGAQIHFRPLWRTLKSC